MMTFFGILLVIVSIIGLVLLALGKKAFETKLDKMRANAERQIARGDMSQSEVDDIIAAEQFPVPGWTTSALIGVSIFGLLLSMFHGMFFYAEPTFKYHIRPIWGGESVVSGETGYKVKGFGRVNNWKIAMSVRATDDTITTDVSSAEDDAGISASLAPQPIVFLDQVDAKGEATVRFRLPDDEETFLTLVHEFRTPENFLNTELIPAVKETFQATGSLMAAEEYFSGGRTDFNNDFANQMDNGIYLVRRIEVRQESNRKRTSSADASAEVQDMYEDDGKVVFKVQKRTDPETGLPLRKTQKFKDYGVTIVSARVTDMTPNVKFKERMVAKQDASAQRAVNREQRIQEEERKFLAIAQGQREIAEVEAAAKKEQKQKTTNAETAKRLALIAATQQKEKAEIEKQTAQLQLDRAEIDAKTKERLADAEAYEKSKILAADNALDKKLQAWLGAQKVWADAFARRQVPNTVFGASGDGSVGGDGDVKAFMNIMTMKAAQDLNVDTSINDVGPQRRALPQQ